MTPRQRVLDALAKRPTGRAATCTPTSVATVALMDQVDAPFPDAHLNADAMTRLAETAHTVLGFDTVMPVTSVVQESVALGCDVDWADRENWPTCRGRLAERPEEIRIPADVLARPTTACVLKSIAELRRRYPDVAIVGKAMGPWTLSYHVFGLDRFLLMTIDDPDAVKRALDRLKELTVLFAMAQIDAGADVICLPDHATGDLVSADTYREFLEDLHTEMGQRIAAPVILHICGRTVDRMPHIGRTGLAGFHFDSKNDVAESLAAIGPDVLLVGNIDNVGSLLNGTPEQVAADTRRLMAAGIRLVGPECAIPLQTPVENLRTITRTVAAG